MMKKLIVPAIFLIILLPPAVTGLQRRPTTPPTVIVKAGWLPGKAGEYNVKTNTIKIDTMHARQAGYTVDQVLAHEMTHYRQHRDRPIRSTIIEILYKNDYENNPLEREARKCQKER